MSKTGKKRKSSPHIMTPARKASLRKAQLASAKKRRLNVKSRKRYSSDPVKRGQGVSGLRKNFTPYLRANKRSQTIGYNTGTIIPGTGRRIAAGSYLRLETTNKSNNPIDRFGTAITNRFAKSGKPAAVRKYFSENVEIKNPAVRWAIPGGQVRIGSSRSAGTTVIVRARSHQTPFKKSRTGVRRYDTRMKAISGQRVKSKKSRAQRRGKGVL